MAWSQVRAAATSSLPVAGPRSPSVAKIEAGVPKVFHRTVAPSVVDASRCAAVGSAEPRRSRSGSATGESPHVATGPSAAAAGEEPVPVAGI